MEEYLSESDSDEQEVGLEEWTQNPKLLGACGSRMKWLVKGMTSMSANAT
jgi:hypothetical protein